jgi:lysine-specific demethylase 3
VHLFHPSFPVPVAVLTSPPLPLSFPSPTLLYKPWPHSLCLTAMNGSIHDPHAHKRTSINELLSPVTSSAAIDQGLPHQPPSYSNGHYAQNASYTHPPMLPPSHYRGTAFKLNPTSWDGADHDRQRLDNISLQRGYAPVAVPPGAYPEFHSHVPQTQEDGLSEPSVSVWPSPERLEAGYGSPSYSDERTCKYLL